MLFGPMASFLNTDNQSVFESLSHAPVRANGGPRNALLALIDFEF